MKHKRTVIYVFLLCGAAVLLALHPVITSTYISLPGSLTYFAATVVPMLLLVALAAKYAETSFSVYAVTLAAVCTIRNSAALPLLQYTSAFDHAVAYAKEISNDTTVTVLTVPVVWFMISALIWLHKQSCKKQNAVIAAVSCVSVLYSILILVLTDTSEETTIIRIGGKAIQAALPAFMLSIVILCVCVKTGGKRSRAMLCGSVVLMNIALVVKGENGLPLVLFAGCSFYYYILQPHRSKLLTYGIPAFSGLGCICGWILYGLRDSLNEESFLYSLAKKIERRIVADTVTQVNSAIRSLLTGGWFGSEGYNVYLTEASSDLSVITILHYCGLFFLLLILAAAIPMFFTGSLHIMCNKMKSEFILCGLCYSVYFIIFFYNLLMGIGLLPILGVQMPFTGSSLGYSVFSGFLLGSFCYPKRAVKAIIVHMKGDDISCVMPEETV